MKLRPFPLIGWLRVICLLILLLATVNTSSVTHGGIISPNEGAITRSDFITETSSFPRLQLGWPQETGGPVDSSPVLGDIDGDGMLEIIIGSNDKKLYAWNSDGTLVNGWPVKTGASIRDSPAIGDIDGDGDIEVIVGSIDGHVYAWHHNGSIVEGWPIKFFDGNIREPPHHGRTSSPALGDVDNDGIREIVIGTHEGPVYIWNGDGTLLDGWPQTAGDGAMSSPALGDINNDGQLEIVCGSFGGNVYVWNPNGSLLAGWPQQTEYVYDEERTSSPALGDLDGDNDLEIVIGSHAGPVYAWHHNGTSVLGWPRYDAQDGTHSSPALGDIDGDGYPEIIIGSRDYNVYVWYANGTRVPGWPQQTQNINGLVNVTLPGVLSCPALADIDGDGDIEIIVGSSDFNVYAWHHTGDLVDGWPIQANGVVISSPAIGDIDDDSRVELVVGSWDHHVYVWEVEGAFDLRNSPWSMFRNNPFHTGTWQDFDGDGLRDTDELDKYYTDPFVVDRDLDSDQDGLQNVAEVDVFGTDPRIADSDGDRIPDGEEISTYGTNPTFADTDGDGLIDGDEIERYYTDPLILNSTSDTDGDGIPNVEEVDVFGTNPTTADTDTDGLVDGEEVFIYHTNPSMSDMNVDTDEDGLTNVEEVDTYGTNPIIADTDGDELLDGYEVKSGTDPLVPESTPEFLPGVLLVLGSTLIFVLFCKRQNR